MKIDDYSTKKNKDLKAEENMEEILEELEEIRVNTPKGFSVRAIREDRDCN